MKKLLLIVLMFVEVSANAQWVQVISPGVYTMSLAASSGGNLIAGTYNYPRGTVAISPNNGMNWFTSLNNQTGYSLLVSGMNIFAGVSDGVYLSTDNGNNWTSVSNGFSGEQVGSLAISGTNIFAGTRDYPYGGIYLSTNNGNNWNQVNNGIPIYDIKALATIGTNIFGSTSYSGVILSTNNGTNWNFVNSGLATGSVVRSFAVLGTKIYACSFDISTGEGYGVFLSTNNGGNWNAVNNGFTSLKVNSLSTSGTNLFAATNSGVFLSTNYGASWVGINQGFGTTPSVSLTFSSNTYSYVTATTNLNSNLWRRPLSEILKVQNTNTETPTTYSLSQNYPNPFNPTTNIKFQVKSSGLAKLVVLDILGKEVATLVNEKLQPGTYETTFDGNGLNSGVYFYELMTDGFTETKRMILLK
ncbi:MAG: T9SS type A sorting domain-containing protein [Candidatus Kapaibacterium sp.]